MPPYATASGCVGRLMRALSARQRTVLVLAVQHDDWTQTDIADEIGVSQQDVSYHWQRIMQIASEIYGLSL